ncbi:MAG: SIS domain-containing protein [Acidimicrobiia bacterium]|nr:SIS domain-containing protein [Acidimicrobiia bacterium]MYG57804.1 SIS domain-containing protein [Acidimicrobiia bacterium]MYJ32047.1 SIS domain-containing protein [Acidimicrobiia bacterium]
MCGIVAVVRRYSPRVPPTSDEVLDLLSPVVVSLRDLGGNHDLATRIGESAGKLIQADRLLQGTAGLQALLGERPLRATIRATLSEIERLIGALEADLDQSAGDRASEAVNAALIQMKDAVWAIGNDRLNTADAVAELAGPSPAQSALGVFSSVQIALSALDRLEVRGRDSAGLHLLVSDHGLDPAAPAVSAALAERAADPLFRSGSVRWADDCLSFVYKAAAEIGELGDNTAALRAAIAADELLAAALEDEGANAAVIGHTRWASVGMINEANAHPLNSELSADSVQPYAIGVLNGDVDNHTDLVAHHNLALDPGITTDAKVIPALWSSRLDPSASADATVDAFRRTMTDLKGSVAIAGQSAANPGQLLLALRGSGQAMYIGAAEDAYVVASEPYGLVEQSNRYLRMDGETPSDPENAAASRGQVVALDRDHAGDLSAIGRFSYDGTPLPVADTDIVNAEMTTRDVDRRGFRHYLLKEITESPESFRKTLRGRIVSTEGDHLSPSLAVKLGPETLPDQLRQRLADRSISDIIVIGQGTAAVAGHSLAHFLRNELPDRQVSSVLATELSGFGMQADMSDTLVIAISQSGTTTDTNRTVDLVRRRGASVIAIVNRRNSDLCDKADGVLYTSDGRDVEMSVASTKAFYAQVAAGVLLAVALADAANGDQPADSRQHGRRQQLLASLRDLPEAMADVLGLQDRIADIVRRHALGRTYWAVVGNGLNRVAAEEVRIKLSELCYKSIACDTTEDKKHIDLSSEPLILVCAAGLFDSTADDVAKEVAIFRAHKAAPIVITSGTEARFDAAAEVIATPTTASPELAFVLATMVGHLFGYESALAIDELAQPLRETRAAIEAEVAASDADIDSQRMLEKLRSQFTPAAQQFFQDLRQGRYNGCLEAGTAAEMASMYRYALGIAPLDAYQLERGRVGTPAVVLEDLTAMLTVAVGELTRPVDAIRHQAKTVTVGISRAEESLLELPLVRAALDAGAPRHQLSYQTLRTLTALDPAVAEVTGYIRYGINGDPESPSTTIHVIDRGGITVGLASRTERDPTLRGSKHLVAIERQVRATRGRSDGRTIVLIPEVKDRQTTGLTLLHVRFQPSLSPETAQQVLEGYRNRFAALRDEVTETEPDFRLDRLGDITTEDLLLEPVTELADRWRP